MPLQVAIIGAGVGGLALAIALKQNHQNLAVQVYERASELKEIGALVGVGPNALRTLEKLGVEDALTDEVGWRNPNGIPMIFKHWKTGELLSQDEYHNVPDRRHHYARMHRAKLQKAMLKKLNGEVPIHLSKKVSSVIAVREKGANVTFEDGTTISADVVIGADGIKSGVRRSFVPDHKLNWLGDVVLRTTLDYSAVADIKEIPQNSSHFSGPQGFFFGTRIGSNGFGVTCSFAVDPESKTDPLNEQVWNAPADVSTIQEKFKDWNPVVRKIIERLPVLNVDVRRYVNIAGDALEYWSFQDRVTLLGDAAHTHGGAWAAGVGLAIDDVYALSRAFETGLPPSLPQSVVSPTQIGEIFALYEATRRPHVERVLSEVHKGRAKTAVLRRRAFDGLGGESDEDFRKRITNRGDPVWVNEHDVEAAFQKALDAQQQKLLARSQPKQSSEEVIATTRL